MPREWWLGCLVWLIMSQPVHAHSPVPGIEGFYIGMLHPFSTPSQALVMLGLGLFVAGYHPDHNKLAFGTFLVATLAGLFAGAWLDEPDTALFMSAVAVCALASLWPRTFVPIVFGVIALCGVLIGQISIPDPGPARDRIITMAGSFVGANIGLLYIAGGVIFLKERYPQPWVEIAFRVVAAWLGAISLVMLALRFAPDGAVS